MGTKLEKIEALMDEEKKLELKDFLFDYMWEIEKEHDFEFRLQVPSLDSKEILIHTGDPQYDLDHRGFWGNGYICEFECVESCIENAWEILLEHCASTLEEN